MPENKIKCELMIIGNGIAGMAASLFAAEKGINAVQVGMAGELTFASGLIDLMGVYPVADGRLCDNPFEANSSFTFSKPILSNLSEYEPRISLTAAANLI